MTRKTHDGLYIKRQRRSGYDTLVVCRDDIPSGLAYAHVDHCITDERDIRRRLFQDSRKMLES